MIEQESYAKTKGELKAQRQHQRRSTVSGCFTVIIVFLILAAIGGVIGWIHLNSRPSVDPFELIDLRFSGRTGRGELEIIKKEPDDDSISPSKIYYKTEKTIGLSEGETIIVEASSESYKLKKSTKKYEVQGLEQYLYDLKSMSKEALSIFEKKSLSSLDKSIKNFNVDMVIESYKAKKVKTCLVTDKKEDSKLYDILQVDFNHLDGTKSTKFYVQEYREVVVREGDPVSVDYSGTIYRGEMTGISSKGKLTQYFFGFETLEDAKTAVLKEKETGMEYQEI